MNVLQGELYWGVLGQYSRVKEHHDPGLLWRDQWTNGANGDGNLFYPGTPDIIGGTTHIPVASLRLKYIRDGVEDYEYDPNRFPNQPFFINAVKNPTIRS